MMDATVTNIYMNALVPIAGVAVVMWTGGLIVLQIKEPKTADSNHHLANAAMACAAYAFLVPLLGLLADRIQTMVICAVFATLYAVMTFGNIRDILVGILRSDGRVVASAVGYLAPTICLIGLVVFPLTSVIALSSGVLIFISYFLLSALARTPKS